MKGFWNIFSQAIWEFAPSTPWQATMGLRGKSLGVFSMASAMRRWSSSSLPLRLFWLLLLSSMSMENSTRA